MGILGDIFRKIFPASHPAIAEADKPTNPTASPAAAPNPAAAPAAMSDVDVEGKLNEMAKANPEKLNWQTSIVDLMKLLGLDSSLTNRKQLAQELHYTGDMNDSASMNIWLHKQVMAKIAANGGKLPAGFGAA